VRLHNVAFIAMVVVQAMDGGGGTLDVNETSAHGRSVTPMMWQGGICLCTYLTKSWFLTMNGNDSATFFVFIQRFIRSERKVKCGMQNAENQVYIL